MLNAAVIGCGLGGGLSLDALHLSDHFRLVAASDLNGDARQKTGDRYPDLQLFQDYRDMLSSCTIDVVCIATPAPSHAPLAYDVLNYSVRGLLLEKPIACNVATAEALLTEIMTRQLPVVVPHGMLALPAPREIADRIRGGDIGRVESIEIQNSVDLLNGGIHWLVYLLELLDDNAPQELTASFDVDGRIVNDGVQVESLGTTRLTMQSRASIVLHSGTRLQPESSVLPKEEQRGAIFRICGTVADIEFSAWAGNYWLGELASGTGRLIRCSADSDPTYHQVFLEQLAMQVAATKPDYHVARLSVAALRLIETAYRTHDGGDWRLGVPARH